MKRIGLLLSALLLQLCVTLFLGTAVSYGYTRDLAPAGLNVWGLDLSGLSRAQISTQLQARIPNSITYKDQAFSLKTDRTFEGIDHWLDKVFPQKADSMLFSVLRSLTRSADGLLTDGIGISREEAVDQLEAINLRISQPMVKATIAYRDGRLVRTEGKAGREMDVDATLTKLSREHQSKQVEAITKEVPAQPSTDDLSDVNDVLGDYTTYFNAGELSRTKNVRMAAMAINNHLIAPGEVFSFNDVVGERTEAAGYQPAIVFVDKSMTLADGGGICQDSSTLYQAVRQAHLSVEEKHTHSLPVSYVPKGQDATVSFGQLDFRFLNDTQGYVLISALMGENSLRIRLFGQADNLHPVIQNPEGYPVRPVEGPIDPK